MLNFNIIYVTWKITAYIFLQLIIYKFIIIESNLLNVCGKYMKNLLIILIIAFGIYYLSTQSGASGVANNIEFDGKDVIYKDDVYATQWTSRSKEISGYVREIKAVDMRIMPIVTYSIVATTGDYSNPERVIINKVGAGYKISYVQAKGMPEGSIIIYHLIPLNADVQKNLERIERGDDFKLTARISKTGLIKSSTAQYQLSSYKPNEYVRIKMENVANANYQLILLVERVDYL